MLTIYLLFSNILAARDLIRVTVYQDDHSKEILTYTPVETSHIGPIVRDTFKISRDRSFRLVDLKGEIIEKGAEIKHYDEILVVEYEAAQEEGLRWTCGFCTCVFDIKAISQFVWK